MVSSNALHGVIQFGTIRKRVHRVGQLQTFERISQTTAVRRSASVRRFNEIDWDFPDQFSQSAFSDLHWHPCRFPSQVPALVIGRLTSIGDAILDPFMGSGTTLVEAQKLGRKSLIDINPIACLMTRAKTLPLSAAEIRKFIASVKNISVSRWDQSLSNSLRPLLSRRTNGIHANDNRARTAVGN